VELAVGNVLIVTLESNPTTGYSWQISQIDDGVLRQEGSPQYIPDSPDSDKVGSGGVEILRFKALATGETDVQLIYHRPWEEDVEPLETFSLQVIVR
jgi:inhibitor of cysteine peptidase